MSKNLENSADSDKEDLLALLQAHGQSFLSSFGPLPQSTARPSRKRRKPDQDPTEESLADGKEELNDEWTGFDSGSSGYSEEDDSEGTHSEDGDEDEDNEHDDDDFRSDNINKRQPEVVIFSGETRSQDAKMSKSQVKSFMSSKVSRLRQDVAESSIVDGDDDNGEYEDERTNLQNDKLLRKLVHTRLLSGSLNSELNLTQAQRRKALEGRVLELAEGAKLGKGEAVVRQEERKKAAKKVRIGLEQKVEERKRKALDEAKDLGNYHSSIKHLFEADTKRRTDRRKRDRGLKLGVGKFSGGVLKLSKDDIASVRANSKPSARGRGGRRGSGRG